MHKWYTVGFHSVLHSVDKENLIVEKHQVFGVEILPSFGRGDKMNLKNTVLMVTIIVGGKKKQVHFDLKRDGVIIDKHESYWFSKDTAEEELIIARTNDRAAVYE